MVMIVLCTVCDRPPRPVFDMCTKADAELYPAEENGKLIFYYALFSFHRLYCLTISVVNIGAVD